MTARAHRTTRLSREDRREQLLDSAAVLLVDKGAAVLTMEGVAAEAGVSKALPYAHFDNAHDLLLALRDRELDRFGQAIVAAVSDATTYEARVAASVHSYFEYIAKRGTVLLAVLSSMPMDESEQAKRRNPSFFATMFEREHGMSEAAAKVASALFIAAVSGAVESWVRKVASRATIEAITVQAVIGGAAAVAAAERSGAIPRM